MDATVEDAVTPTTDTAVLEAPAEAPSPVPVHGEVRLAGRVATSEEAADFGNYRTIVLAGTEDKQQILPYDPHRIRAWLLVTGTGPVYIGSESQCAAIKGGGPPAAGGAQLAAGGPLIPIGHKQAVWLIPDGSHTATVVVGQERMRS